MGVVQRLNQFIEIKGISKYKFYKKTGLSNGSLDKGDNLGSDKCEKICYSFPEINPIWLLTGQGEMLSGHQAPSRPKDSPSEEIQTLLKEKDARIASLEKTIASQDRTIELLEEKIAVLSAPPVVPVVDTAAAG